MSVTILQTITDVRPKESKHKVSLPDSFRSCTVYLGRVRSCIVPIKRNRKKNSLDLEYPTIIGEDVTPLHVECDVRDDQGNVIKDAISLHFPLPTDDIPNYCIMRSDPGFLVSFKKGPRSSKSNYFILRLSFYLEDNEFAVFDVPVTSRKNKYYNPKKTSQAPIAGDVSSQIDMSSVLFEMTTMEPQSLDIESVPLEFEALLPNQLEVIELKTIQLSPSIGSSSGGYYIKIFGDFGADIAVKWIDSSLPFEGPYQSPLGVSPFLLVQVPPMTSNVTAIVSISSSNKSESFALFHYQ